MIHDKQKKCCRYAKGLVCGLETGMRLCVNLMVSPARFRQGKALALVGCVYSSAGLLAVNKRHMMNDGLQPVNTSRCSSPLIISVEAAAVFT